MSDLLKYAYEVRLVAEELEFEAAGKIKDVFVTDDEKLDTKEQSQYRQYLNKLVVAKDLAPYLDIFKVMINPQMLNRPIQRNVLIQSMQKLINEVSKPSPQSKSSPLKSIKKEIEPKQLPINIMRFIKTVEQKGKNNPDYLKNHAVYKLLLEILNYLVVKGIQGMRRLLLTENMFKTQFSRQKEHQGLEKIKEETQTKK
jgi:hypothetical protein